MADFKVKFLRRLRGAIGEFAWGDWRVIRDSTAERSIELAREFAGEEIETAGVLCELIQPGDALYVAN